MTILLRTPLCREAGLIHQPCLEKANRCPPYVLTTFTDTTLTLHFTVTLETKRHRRESDCTFITGPALLFYLFSSWCVRNLQHWEAVCFQKWIPKPAEFTKKWKVHIWKEMMCCWKTCLWQLQNTPHKTFERVESWQFCDCLHGNGERVSLGQYQKDLFWRNIEREKKTWQNSWARNNLGKGVKWQKQQSRELFARRK